MKMAEKKNNPAGVVVLIIIILVALFFIIKQAMPKKAVAPTELPPGMEAPEMPPAEVPAPPAEEL
jgi:hypothetical protein